MHVHLVDGTYELFRALLRDAGQQRATAGRSRASARRALARCCTCCESGATHVGVATDHVIESFRNELWPGYKTGDGIDPALLAQFPPLEEALAAMGIVVWAMVEFEADDALAAAARLAAADPRVEQVLICTPDKDLAQCVCGERVVQLDGAASITRDEAGVRAQVRRGAGVDPRLAGAGRRQRRRLSRVCRAGAPSRPPPCSRATAISRRSRRRPRDWAADVRGTRPPGASLREGRERCSSGCWRRCADAPIGARHR